MAETPDQRPSLVEQAQDELVCPICTDFFVRPRSLICLHSFCENCLVQLWRVSGEEETLTCPECRAKTSLSDEAVADILGFDLHSLYHTAIIQSVMCEGSEHTHLHVVSVGSHTKDTIQFLWRMPLDMMLHTIRQT